MNRQIYRGVALCGLLYLLACTPTPEPSPPVVLPDYSQYPHQLAQRGDTLLYAQRLLGAYYPNPDEYSQRDSTVIELSFPWMDSSAGALADTLNQALQVLLLREAQGATTLEERLQRFVDEFAEHKEDMKAFGLPSTNWSFELRVQILLNNPQLLTLYVHQLEYTGGAHANTWTSYLNYAIPTGQLLTLDDLLKEGEQDQFEQLAQHAFIRQLQGSTLSEPLSLLDSSAFVVPTLFEMKLNGVQFHYRPYDLGSFASEGWSFFMSYQELLPVLDTGRLTLVPVENQSDTLGI